MSKLGSWVTRKIVRLRELARRKKKSERVKIHQDGKREPIAAPMFPSRNPARYGPGMRSQKRGNPDGKTFEERYPNYVCAVRPNITQDAAGRIRIGSKPSMPSAPSWQTRRVLGGGTRRIVKQKHGKIGGREGAHP